jgi:hypothetical protein
MPIVVYLRNGAAVELPTGVDVEPTRFPSPGPEEGRAALEVLDAQGEPVACFVTGELAGYTLDHAEGG